MTIVLYTFSKRPDSTKRPSSGGRSLSATLKEATSILYPSFLFQFSGNPTAYNYAYVPDFDRYYYITDWTSTAGMWDAACKVDVLASWKDSIGASKQYVLRAEAESDGVITDSLYPLTNEVSVKTVPNQSSFEIDTYHPEYVVGIIGGSSEHTLNGVSYYKFNQDQYNLFLAGYLDMNNWGSAFNDLGSDVAKAIFNPMQYLSTVSIVPSGVIDEGSSVNTINAGWFSVDLPGSILDSTRYEFNYKFNTIPHHPQYTDGEFLDCTPFSKYVLVLPAFGSIEIDGSLLRGKDRNILVSCQCDVASNTATADVIVNGSHFASLSGSFGGSIQLSEQRTEPLTAATQTGGVISNAIAGDFLGAATGIASALISIAVPHAQTVGSFSDYTKFWIRPQLYCYFTHRTDEDLDGKGRPLCKTRRISTLPGFVQVSDAKIAFNCTSPETAEIKNFMEGGFHYE